MNGIHSQREADFYVSRSRSLRIGRSVTSVRLENLYWDVLAEIAEAKGLRTSQLIQSLCTDTIGGSGKASNLASRLRVTCLRYACLKAEGRDAELAGEDAVRLAVPPAPEHDLRCQG